MSDFAEEPYSELQPPNDTTTVMIKSMSLVIMICAGAIENATVIYTLFGERKFHRAPYYYVVNLSLADLMRSTLCLPFVLATVMQGSVWKYGRSGCKFLAFTSTLLTFGALFALLILGLDRHMSVVHFRFHSRRFKGLMCLAMVLSGWIVAFLLAIPPVFGLGTYQFIPIESQCAFEHRYYTNNDTLGFTMIFIAAIALTVFVYVRIFIFLRKHRKMRPIIFEPARSSNWAFYGPGANGLAPQGNNNNLPIARVITYPQNIGQPPNNQPFITARFVQTVSPKNERLTRLFAAVTVLFDLLWVPYIIMCMWMVFNKNGDVPIEFSTVATWLTYSQVAVLPVVYFAAHPPFRHTLRRSRSTGLQLDGHTLREYPPDRRNNASSDLNDT